MIQYPFQRFGPIRFVVTVTGLRPARAVWQPLAAQEDGVKQLGLVASPAIAMNYHHGVARPHRTNDPDGHGDVQPGRPADRKPLVLQQLDHLLQRLSI